MSYRLLQSLRSPQAFGKLANGNWARRSGKSLCDTVLTRCPGTVPPSMQTMESACDARVPGVSMEPDTSRIVRRAQPCDGGRKLT